MHVAESAILRDNLENNFPFLKFETLAKTHLF